MGRYKLELREIWRSGIPLSEAWLEYAPAEDRRAYRALEMAPLRDPELDMDGASMAVRQIERLGRQWKRDSELGAARELLKAAARDRFERSTLVAIGYLTDANGVTRLVVIDPEQIITGDIRWIEDLITSGGLKFVRVVVVTRESFHEARSAISARGRRGKYQKIDEAIDFAIAADSRILEQPNKRIIPKLRDILFEIDPDGISSENGYSISSFNNRLSAARSRKRMVSEF